MALPKMMQDVWDNHLDSLTPMMKMYLETKKQHDDCIIFYRLGDFYEMFFDDATTASKEMEITLTGKSCGLEERAPMCGVPYHAVDSYINRLVTKGYKVCIVEQTEDPAQAKGLVKREVVRIVTPGTNLNTAAMDEGRNNYIMSIAYIGGKFGISIADVTTGDYYVTEVTTERNVVDEINKFMPSEIICNHSFLMSGMDIDDLKDRLGRIIVAYNYAGEPVTAADLKAVGAMAALLKDAIKPNMIQTLEGTPALVHGGPFANIAHGCNSVRATKAALKMADYVVTEAGFGADLGAEKFMDIKCRKAGIAPDAVVILATVKALKYNGGVKKDELAAPNLEAVKKGIVNLDKHIENLHAFGVPVVVTLNSFLTDTEEEYEFIKKHCEDMGCEFALARVWAEGGKGGEELAAKVIRTIENKKSELKFTYELDAPLKDKIEAIATKIYGAGSVTYSAEASRMLKKIEKMGYGNLPVCMAKNQYSLSDDPNALGRPEGFNVNIREVYVSAGAGFVVAITGTVMTMPGLPKVPAAENIDVVDDKIVGLF